MQVYLPAVLPDVPLLALTLADVAGLRFVV